MLAAYLGSGLIEWAAAFPGVSKERDNTARERGGVSGRGHTLLRWCGYCVVKPAPANLSSGCLIIQVQDHRSSTAKATSKTDNTTVPGSIHNYNLWITPSPTVPYPDAAKQEPKPPKVVEVKKKEVEKSEKAKGPKIYTTVMHPTPLSLYADMEVLACTLAPVAIRANMRNGSVSVAPTPTSATNPHTPGLTANAAAGTPTSPVFKKPRMMLSDSTAPNFEANTLLATSPQLILTPAKSAEQAHEIHKALRNPRHCNPIPPPKTRKRTIAELQADEAAAAGQEAFLLLGSPQSAAPESAVADGPEPTFKRFKAIEEIKRKAVEKKREEKAKEVQKARAEHDARQQREKQQRQQQQREDLEQRKMAAVRAASASQHGSPVLPQAVTMHHTSSAQNNGSISVTTTRPGSAGAVPQPVMSREQAAARMQSQYSTTQQQQVAHHQLQMLRQQQHQQQQQQQQQQHQQQQAAAAQAAAQAAAAAHGHDPHLAVSHPSQASPRLAQASPRIAQASPRIAPSQPHPLSQPPHTSAHLTSTAAATNAYQQQQIRLAVAQQQAAHRASPLHHPPGTVLGPNGQPQGHPVQQHPVQMPPQYRIMQPQQHNAAAAAAAMQFQQLSPQQQLFYQQQQQHHHQQQQMYHQQQMQAGRGAALVGKTAGGAIRAGQMGRGIMMPNGQPGQPQGQFQDLGFAIGAAPQGMQVGMQGMMGRGQMGMGRGR